MPDVPECQVIVCEYSPIPYRHNGKVFLYWCSQGEVTVGAYDDPLQGWDYCDQRERAKENVLPSRLNHALI